MSHTFVKAKYMELGAYGSEEWHTLYCHHNHSCDIVSFYNEKGECILSFGDTEHPNIFEVMDKLNFPFKDAWNGELLDGVQYLNEEDREIINRPITHRP